MGPRAKTRSSVRAASGVLSIVGALLNPSASRADYVSLLPSTQPAIDVDSVAVGSWSRYRHESGQGADLQRFSMVGDAPDGRVLEVLVESPSFLEPVLFRFFVPRGGGVPSGPSPLDVQVGNGAPLRALLPSASKFPDFMAASARVGAFQSRIGKVTLATTRYRHRLGEDRWEYEVSPKAAPLGFITSTKTIAGVVSRLQLLELGTGATPRMTKAPRHVAPADLMKALAANVRLRPSDPPAGGTARKTRPN